MTALPRFPLKPSATEPGLSPFEFAKLVEAQLKHCRLEDVRGMLLEVMVSCCARELSASNAAQWRAKRFWHDIAGQLQSVLNQMRLEDQRRAQGAPL